MLRWVCTKMLLPTTAAWKREIAGRAGPCTMIGSQFFHHVSAACMLSSGRSTLAVSSDGRLTHIENDLLPCVGGKVQSVEVAQDVPSILLVAWVPACQEPKLVASHHCLRCDPHLHAQPMNVQLSGTCNDDSKLLGARGFASDRLCKETLPLGEALAQIEAASKPCPCRSRSRHLQKPPAAWPRPRCSCAQDVSSLKQGGSGRQLLSTIVC